MCVLLAKEGRTAEAIEDYRKALAIKPDNAEARFNLGNALLRQDASGSTSINGP